MKKITLLMFFMGCFSLLAKNIKFDANVKEVGSELHSIIQDTDTSLPVDFEDDANLMYDFLGFEGADSALEENPDATGENTSATVMRSIKTDGAQFFAGTLLNLDTVIAFSDDMGAISINTWSPKSDIPIRMRLENADNTSGIELDVNTTVANAWETLTFDFSSMIDPNVDYVRVVVFFEFIGDLPGDGSTYFFDNIELAETDDNGGGNDGADVSLPVGFEDNETLMYNFGGFEGADSALEANPDATGENTSATVMRSTKTDGAQFFAGTFLRLDVPIAFADDMGAISINTWSPKADIPVRVRLENADNTSGIELDVNTTVANSWETLIFDFSSLIDSNVEYVTVVVFFEFIGDLPGDGSTYFFDNIELAETDDNGGGNDGADVSLPVGFEDNETLMYNFGGFEGADSALEANPDATGENTSATVMRSTKTDGAQFFAGTFLRLDVPIAFSDNMGAISINTWSPKSDIPVRIRLENADNTSGIELDVNTTVANAWETLTFDFSSVMDSNVDYVTVVVFFEFVGDLPGDGSTYFFDNIELAETDDNGGGNDGADVSLPVDFEDNETLMYEFGGFEGADSALEANPDATGDNTSATVMRSIKTDGSAFFAGTFLRLDVPIAFADDMGAISINTWSPKVDIPVRVRLENADNTSGIELDVNTTVANSWETLTFDFSSLINSNVDYVTVVVFFEFIGDLPGDGSTYFFDNIELAETVDNGGGNDGTEVSLPVDFEDNDTLMYEFGGFEGADSALEANPDATGENTSATVMRSIKTDGSAFFAGTFLRLDVPIAFADDMGAISINTWSPKADIPVRVRLENADNTSGIELDVNTTVANSWETLTFDFSSLIDSNVEYVTAVVFFEFVGDLPGDGSTYFFDNIELAETVDNGGGNDNENPVTLPINFEDITLVYDFFGFEGAASRLDGNPDPEAPNDSQTVLRTEKTDGAQFFAGTLINLDEPIDFSGSNVIDMSSYSPKANIPVRFAIENQEIGADSQIVVDVNTTVADAWETLSFDFSSLIDPTIGYDRVVVFYEFIVDVPGDGSIYYFDNIGIQGTLSVEETNTIELSAFPNPASNIWNIQSSSNIDTIRIYDVVGKMVLSQEPNTNSFTIDATGLKTGIYFAQIQSESSTQTIRLMKR